MSENAVIEAVREPKRARRSARMSEYRRARFTANITYIQSIKLERGCIECGYNAHHAGLLFVHIDNKKADVSGLAVSASREHLDAVIAKCFVRCANCHALAKARRRKGLTDWWTCTEAERAEVARLLQREAQSSTEARMT